MAATPGAWSWAAIYILLAILMPLLYIIWLVHQGRVSDLDVQLREQRSRPLLAAVAGALTAWLVLYLGAAPYLLVSVASATWIQTALTLGITLRWKISVHCAVAAGVAVLVWYVLGSVAAPVLVGVLLIAWSRVRLGRHTPAQTLAGALLGVLIFSAILFRAS
jgi:membrane-associated phospholipid phosphatase